MPLHDPNTIETVVTIAPRIAATVLAAIVATLTAAHVAHTQREK